MQKSRLILFQGFIITVILLVQSNLTGCNRIKSAMFGNEGAGSGLFMAAVGVLHDLSGAPMIFTVGGTVSGLQKGGLILQLNGAENLEVNESGIFTFEQTFANGASYPYTVTILQQPEGQNCIFRGNERGMILTRSVSRVRVACINDTLNYPPYFNPAPAKIAALSTGGFVVSAPARKQLWFYNGDGMVTRIQGLSYRPYALGADSQDRVYVGNKEQRRIDVFSREGTPLRNFGGDIKLPNDIAIHEPGDRIYVIDSGDKQVEVFDLNGSPIATFGAPGTLDGEFLFPVGITVNGAAEEVAVSDFTNKRIQFFSYGGGFKGAISMPEKTVSLSMMMTIAAGGRPLGITTDPAGRYLVVDILNGSVLIYPTSGSTDPTGSIGTFGQGTTAGELNNPTDIATTANGDLLVTNTGNRRIEVFTNY